MREHGCGVVVGALVGCGPDAGEGGQQACAQHLFAQTGDGPGLAGVQDADVTAAEDQGRHGGGALDALEGGVGEVGHDQGSGTGAQGRAVRGPRDQVCAFDTALLQQERGLDDTGVRSGRRRPDGVGRVRGLVDEHSPGGGIPLLVAHDPPMDLVGLERGEQAGVELDLAQDGEERGRCAAARAGAAGDEEVLAAGEVDQPIAEFGSDA
ncbi:hypothetical protein ICJ52_21730 [Streptomyces sp. KD18]|nr:hypothetical protein [Streptomyces sp. KD18]